LKKFILFLLVSFLQTILFAQNPRYDSIIYRYTKENRFSGVVFIGTNDEDPLEFSSEVFEQKLSRSLDSDSKFRIASMTKVFTAVLVMKLVEEGKIDLNKTIGTYFPSYAGAGRDSVTIHHLLTYSSGIENQLEPLGMLPYQKEIPLDKFIQTYCSGKLEIKPGTESRYGNTEYILLHKIIELTSGSSYKECLKKYILKPLKLKHTSFAKKNTSKGDVPSFLFSDSLRTFKAEEEYFPSMYFASGCLSSTAKDLFTFSQALFSGELLKNESLKTMLTIHPELGYTAYGLWGSTGWGNFDEPFYYRTGGILGSNCNWIRTLKSNKTIIIFSNSNSTNLYQLTEELYLESLKEN
jgi:CubicO group peptidase (beta-lactamase class C family)